MLNSLADGILACTSNALSNPHIFFCLSSESYLSSTGSQSTIYFPSILKALLAASLAVSGVAATDNDIQEENAESSTVSYGKCYKLSHPTHGVLGHQNVRESYLSFTGKKDDAVFKVTYGIGQYENLNNKKQGLKDNARFWLRDMNHGVFVTPNSYPFPNNGLFLPEYGNSKYFVNFWAVNDCDSKQLGKCTVKLNAENMRTNQGISLDRSQRLVLGTPESTIPINFNEVACPK